MAAASIVASGGFSVVLAGIRLRAHRPWALLGVCAIGWIAAHRLSGTARIAQDLEAAWALRDRGAAWLAGAAAVVTLIVGLACGTWSAGGADAYGYVSQALLWTKGEPIVEQRLARVAPWPHAAWTTSPLGYRPGPAAGTIVPTYPPGLPLMMAAASAIAGTPAVFWIVPLMGAWAVWLTFLLGRRLAGASAGAAAAILTATSPVFLYQLVQPMSDVPVTAWWMAGLLLVLIGRPTAGGMSVAAAVLTRPNLTLLALWLLLGVAMREQRQSRSPWRAARAAIRFSTPVGAAAVFLLGLNQRWYGHPLASGYGSPGELYALANVPLNLWRYVSWLWQTQTPFVFAGLAVPILAWMLVRRGQAGSATPRPATLAFVLGVPLIVLVSYLVYAVFNEWWYLRFLLPGLPVLLVLSSALAFGCATRLPASLRLPVVGLGLAMLAARYVHMAEAGQAFDLRALEERYRATGTFVSQQLSPHAVLLSVQQSGSLRLYSGRQTLRYDWIDPAWLDRVLDHLRRAGFHPYFALEAWEEPEFRARFQRDSHAGGLDWPPAGDLAGRVRVRVYDPAARAAYLAGRRGAPPPRAPPPDRP